MMDDKVIRNNDSAYRIIDGVAIIVNPVTGVMYTLNEVGSRIWELADGSRTVSEIVDFIYDQYEAEKADIDKDIDAFLQDLVEKQIISIG